MNALYERLILGAIECHELFGEHDMARKLTKEYLDKKSKAQDQETETANTSRVFEGTLVAVGWDQSERINQTSLYTQEDEDILLEHGLGMEKFKPFINQKVQVWGEVTANGREERRVSVKKIIRLWDGFTKPLVEKLDEFGNSIIAAA